MAASLGQAIKKMKYQYKFFRGKDIQTDLKALQPYFNNLSDDNYLQSSQKLPFNKIMRQRRMMGYNIEFDKSGNITQFHEDYQVDEFDQDQKLLHYARLYDEFTLEMKNDQNFKNFIYNSLQVIKEIKPIKKATLTCHAIRTISYDDQPAEPTPEGPHLDGVDFEVIALVNKDNCLGAESQIYSPEKKNLLFEMTLDSGDGYIIDGLNLWHYATPHRPVDPKKIGTRDLLGYLLKVHEIYKD